MTKFDGRKNRRILRRSFHDDLMKLFIGQNLIAIRRTSEAAAVPHQLGLDAEVAEVVATSGARWQHRRTTAHLAVDGEVRRRGFGSWPSETVAFLGQEAGCKQT